MSFVLIPGVAVFVMFGVRLFVAGVRGRRRRPADIRRANAKALARLDAIARRAPPRDRAP